MDALQQADIPIYQIAAPAQAWNAYGATSNALLTALGDASTTGGTFAGVVLAGGSHVDSMLGVNPIFDAVLQLVTGRVPAGNTAAVYTLSTGWINDMYSRRHARSTAKYGFYAGANQAIIMGPTAALALPSPVLNQLSLGDKIVTSLIDAVGGIFGFSILPDPREHRQQRSSTSVSTPPLSNGVTGVRTGSAVLDIPCGPNGYAAPADWYFPTQADGTVQANGVIWLQHGFLGFKSWYAAEAQQLAQETNSIVVVPNIFWFDTPICPGCFLGGEDMRKAVATMFQDGRSALNVSANAAGLDGPLPQKFLLTGHSAGGNFATASRRAAHRHPRGRRSARRGDVRRRRPRRPVHRLADRAGRQRDPRLPDRRQAAELERLGCGHPADVRGLRPDSVLRRPDRQRLTHRRHRRPQPLREARRNRQRHHRQPVAAGRQRGGAHLLLRLDQRHLRRQHHLPRRTQPNPCTASTGATATTPTDPVVYTNQPIVMGKAGASTLPSPPPVDLPKYLGTWYEQGSVKQFFSLGLVNTKAVYTLNPDGSIKVQNSGNYFGPNGPQSNITGAALVVNPDFNTRLNVGFFFGQPNNTNEPGNYWILDYGPGRHVDGQYEWAIVSDSSGSSGFILTRDQTITEAEYNALVARAKQLGVSGRITPTAQYPTARRWRRCPGRRTCPQASWSDRAKRSGVYPHQTPRETLDGKAQTGQSVVQHVCVGS